MAWPMAMAIDDCMLDHYHWKKFIWLGTAMQQLTLNVSLDSLDSADKNAMSDNCNNNLLIS